MQAPFAEVTCWALFLLYLRMDTFGRILCRWTTSAKLKRVRLGKK